MRHDELEEILDEKRLSESCGNFEITRDLISRSARAEEDDWNIDVSEASAKLA
jgi:hypothetical protein